MSSFDDMVPEFIAESTTLLAEVENGLLKLEQGAADPETTTTVFRAVHSIKGGAGFIGLRKIEDLAKKMEGLLNLIRGGDLDPIQPVTDSLLQSLDVLAALFQRINEQDAIDIDGPIRALEAALSAGVDHNIKSRYESRDTPAPESGLPAFSISRYVLESKFKQGNLYHLRLKLGLIEKRGLTPIQLVNELLSLGELVDSVVDIESTGAPNDYYADDVTCHVLYSTVLEPDLLAPSLRLEPDEFHLVTQADFVDSPGGVNIIQPVVTPTATPRQSAQSPVSPPVVTRAATEKPHQPVGPQNEPEQESEANKLEYLTISLGRETYGVNILSVQEIIGIPSLTILPRTPEHVLGVMNLRGMVVPVVDLRLKFNMPDDCPEPVIIVVRVGSKIIGAVVDQVNDVAEISRDEIQAPPAFSGKIKRDYISGLTRHNGDLVIMLELDRLLAPEAMGDAA